MITASEIQGTLRDLLVQYGPPNNSNSRMYNSVLNSALANNPREAELLELSIDQNIPARLYAQKGNPQIIAQLVQELITTQRINGHAAEWMVKTWAKSMGMDVPSYQPSIHQGKMFPNIGNNQQQSYQFSYNRPPVPQGVPTHNTRNDPQESYRPTTYRVKGISHKLILFTSIIGIGVIFLVVFFGNSIFAERDVSGRWMDTDGVPITLTQDGNKVTGNFLLGEKRYGYSDVGVDFSGKLSGNILTFTYTSNVISNGVITPWKGEGKITFDTSFTTADIEFDSATSTTIDFKKSEQPMITGRKYSLVKVSDSTSVSTSKS